MQKNILVLLLGLMFSDIEQAQAADFSAQALEQAAAAYNKPTGALAAMQQLEHQDNGFVALMLARCFNQGVAGCLKNNGKAQLYLRQQNIIQQYLEKLAINNNVQAYNWLGNIKRDSGTLTGKQQAIQYFEKSAALNNPYAMVVLGQMYDTSLDGFLNNNYKAFEWYKKSANLGDITGIFNTAAMYENGRGITKDEYKAAEWYQKAADLGMADAMTRLAQMYDEGRGVRQSDSKAFEYYQKAAVLDNISAMYALGVMYGEGRGVVKNENKAFEWYQKAAYLGDARALYNLGWIYEKGQGVAQNDVKAFEYYQKAADLGDPDAMFNLGLMYVKGQGIPKNERKTIDLYEKASNLGKIEATYNLAIMYQTGQGVTKDYKKAAELYKIASDKDMPAAIINLGNMYKRGEGGVQDDKMAFELFSKAADMNVPHALFNLGLMYRDGRGTVQDNSKALATFNKGLKIGSLDSAIAIGKMVETGTKGMPANYNNAAKIYLGAMKIGKKDYIKEYFLEPLLLENKITDPEILKQTQAYFHPAPILSWVKKPENQTEQDTIDFSVNLKNTGFGIGNVRVLVDGIPVESGGRDFGSTIQGGVQRNFSISLPQGHHKIRVEANNAENVGVPAVLEMSVESVSKEVRKPKIYAVVVGIDQFQNSDATLKYAVADAKAVFSSIKKQVGDLYDEGTIQLLTTQAETSKQSIQNAFEQVKKQARLDDVFVFYVASHGTTFDDIYYMFSSDLLQTSPERMKKASFSTEELQDLFAQIPTSKKLVFIDTCHSGGGVNANKISSSRDIMEDQQMIEHIRKRTGVTVLMASGSEQKAQEGYKGHGVFTYTILQALSGQGDRNKDGFVDSGELISYVDDYVPKIAKEAFGKVQVPSVSMAGQSLIFKVNPY